MNVANAVSVPNRVTKVGEASSLGPWLVPAPFFPWQDSQVEAKIFAPESMLEAVDGFVVLTFLSAVLEFRALCFTLGALVLLPQADIPAANSALSTNSPEICFCISIPPLDA